LTSFAKPCGVVNDHITFECGMRAEVIADPRILNKKGEKDESL
jgi:hypothetical protein